MATKSGCSSRLRAFIGRARRHRGRISRARRTRRRDLLEAAARYAGADAPPGCGLTGSAISRPAEAEDARRELAAIRAGDRGASGREDRGGNQAGGRRGPRRARDGGHCGDVDARARRSVARETHARRRRRDERLGRASCEGAVARRRAKVAQRSRLIERTKFS
jgi:hypothetical protein